MEKEERGKKQGLEVLRNWQVWLHRQATTDASADKEVTCGSAAQGGDQGGPRYLPDRRPAQLASKVLPHNPIVAEGECMEQSAGAQARLWGRAPGVACQCTCLLNRELKTADGVLLAGRRSCPSLAGGSHGLAKKMKRSCQERRVPNSPQPHQLTPECPSKDTGIPSCATL